MVLNFAYSVSWQTPSVLCWILYTQGFPGLWSTGLVCSYQNHAKVFINNIGMLPAHSMPPLCYFFWFSHLPKGSDNPTLVVLVSLPHASPFLFSTASPAEGMRSLNKEMAGKPSKGMLVSCCWLRCVALRRRLQAGCSDAALWPNTWSCSVTAHPLTWPWLFVTGVVLLESTYYTFPKWRTQSLFQRTTSTNYLCI